jgi:hypothetical protein
MWICCQVYLAALRQQGFATQKDWVQSGVALMMEKYLSALSLDYFLAFGLTE